LRPGGRSRGHRWQFQCRWRFQRHGPDKGKQTCVVLDDDEVSSDEDEPLQKRLRQLSGARLVVLDEAATTDKEATGKRAVEEATVERAVEERAAEEATMKKAAEERAAEEATTKAAVEERAVDEATAKAATEEAAVKATTAEAAGAAGGSPRPGVVSGRGQEGCGSKCLHPAGQTSLKGCLETSICPAFSPPYLFCGASFSYYPFCPSLLPPARPPQQTQLLQMRLSGRLWAQNLSASPGPLKESLRTWWSLRGS
jgi:hypothetical protein